MRCVLLWLACLSSLAAAHDTSLSDTLLVVEGPGVTHLARLQVQSVGEVLKLDADGNGLVTEDELAAVADDLVRYLSEHYRLRPVRHGVRGSNLPARAISVRLVTDDSDALRFSQWVELELERRASEPFDQLQVEMDLFLATSPGHRDLLEALWAEPHAAGEPLTGPRWSESLWAGRPRVLLDPGRRTAADRLREGGRLAGGQWPATACLLLLLAACGLRRQGLLMLACWLGSVALGLALAPWLASSLPALPLASNLVLATLGVVTLLRPGLRPVLLEAALVGVLAGLRMGRAAATGALAAGDLGELASARTLPVAGSPPAFSAGLGWSLGWATLALLLPALALVFIGPWLGAGRQPAPAIDAQNAEDATDAEAAADANPRGARVGLVPRGLALVLAALSLLAGAALSWRWIAAAGW